MTSITRNCILFDNKDSSGFYCISNQYQHDFADYGNPDYLGLLVRPEKPYYKRLVDFVRNADVDIMESCYYMDEGLFKALLVKAFLGEDTAGWRITEISIGQYSLCFELHNPALNKLGYKNEDIYEEFKRIEDTLGYSDEEKKVFTGSLSPAPQVLVFWNLSGWTDNRLEDIFCFTVCAPKYSGKYPKTKRTHIKLLGDGHIAIEEHSKKHCREIRFLEQSPRQIDIGEQPVQITETYLA